MPYEIWLWLFFLWFGAYEYIFGGYIVFAVECGDQSSDERSSYIYHGYFTGVNIFVLIRVLFQIGGEFIGL